MFETRYKCMVCGAITVFVTCPICGNKIVKEDRDAQYGDD